MFAIPIVNASCGLPRPGRGYGSLVSAEGGGGARGTVGKTLPCLSFLLSLALLVPLSMKISVTSAGRFLNDGLKPTKTYVTAVGKKISTKRTGL